MLYGILRIIFWGLIYACVFLLIMRKSGIVRKKFFTTLSLILCLIFGSISSLFPIENFFISFESPSEVLHYYQTGEVDDLIYGNDSCMVIYSQRNHKSGHFIVPSSEKEYKIPSLFSVKKVSHKFDTDGIFDIYNVLGTNDYYLTGTIISNEREIVIVDNNNKPVKSIIIEMGDTGTKTVYLYSSIRNFTSGNYLLINGVRIQTTDD